MANENSITLGADTAKRWLAHKNWDPKIIEYLVFGITIHQLHGFYGSPYAAALIGCPDIPGVLLSQACTTSTTCIWQAVSVLRPERMIIVFV